MDYTRLKSEQEKNSNGLGLERIQDIQIVGIGTLGTGCQNILIVALFCA